jgi:UDP-N-acetylglucosamine--N-acetylmuramyl-(pentapeptide) pyrophosphoryl-undecaprenol N-acetylglucosamine transferase
MGNEIRVVLTGGLSGGHTFPLIAVARAIRERAGIPVSFLYLGSSGQFEGSSMSAENIPMKGILSGKIRRYFSFMNFVDPFKVPIGLVQSIFRLFVYMPDVVFAKGGSVSVPVCLAAWMLRIPIVIHDSDAVAGRANRLLSRFASRVAIAYPSAQEFFPAGKTALTGNPVRSEILSGDAGRADARFGLIPEKPLVLVLGGSQGAKSLNDAVIRILPELLREAQVIHQVGEANYREAVAFAGEVGVKAGYGGYVPAPFLAPEDLADAMARANLVVSRAGAGSIAEIAACGKVAILVPLPTAANDEQRENAYDVARLGGALVLEEGNLGEHLLLSEIDALLRNPDLCADMSRKIRSFHNPEAANMIADGVLSLVS